MFILVCDQLPLHHSLTTPSSPLGQTKIADLVQIAPADFSKRSIDAIEDNINAKYSNKVSCAHHPLLG